MLYPQEQGGFTGVFAASAPRDNPEILHGAYICPPNRVTPQAPHALDEARQQQLFDCTLTHLREIEPWKLTSIPTIIRLKEGAEEARLVESDVPGGLAEFVQAG
ncbi:hypothetical protein H0H81_004989 [Sphagnurus paluster]|uniref:Thioredoxin domain-containing protein n=1 Tax=Sphagnurus paluster TaxID=117069 RepID=A0A9P7GND5_9AGAR|nr:hypothetical protein H0H81_004989 [Sphagnurus paluster]